MQGYFFIAFFFVWVYNFGNENFKERLSMFDDLYNAAAKAAALLANEAGLEAGDIFVVGCSTSEICGDKIGTNSNYDVAAAVFDGIYSELKPRSIFLAAQCCEHLNRALVIEEECRKSYGLEEVCVIPQPKAGGSFATNAYNKFKAPVVVEEISANAGIDIGGTLIGMHIRRVCVPVRLGVEKIGNARIICAKTRPKLIGGERAIYQRQV